MLDAVRTSGSNLGLGSIIRVARCCRGEATGEFPQRFLGVIKLPESVPVDTKRRSRGQEPGGNLGVRKPPITLSHERIVVVTTLG